MKKALTLTLAFAILFSVSGFGQVRKPTELKFFPLQYEPPDPGNFRTLFPNGLRGYLQEDRSFPLFTLSALVNFGSLYVPKGKQGLEAIMGETLIKGGTNSKEGSVIEERIDFLGGTLNFSVGERTSTLTMSILSKDLDEGLALFFDVLMNPEFRESSLNLARARQIDALRRANDQPSSILSREYERLLYSEHPLTWQPTQKTLEGVTVPDLKQAHRQFFFPGNIILASAGDFSKVELKAKIEKIVACWPNRELQLPAVSKEFPAPEPGVYFIQKAINQGHISLGHLGIEETNPDYHAVQVMNFILGGGSFSSRITMKVRSNEGLSYNQGSRFSYRWGFPGLFSAYVQTKSSTVGYAISLIQAELERIRKEPVTDAEMETATNYYLESFADLFQSPQITMSNFANLEMTGRPMDYYKTYRNIIKSVTKARVQEVANKYLHPDQAAIMIVGDFEPSNTGGEKWPGPMDKLGKVHKISLPDPLTGEPVKEASQ
jgi:predicted Zn-dependent peptidase